MSAPDVLTASDRLAALRAARAAIELEARAADRESADAVPAVHSDELEQAVLGAILLDNRAADRLSGLVAADDFYAGRHREIFGAISRLLAAGQAADVVTVFEALKLSGRAEAVGGLAYLNALAASVPSAANVRRYAEGVHRYAVRRTLIATIDSAGEVAREDEDPASALDRVTSMLGELQRRAGPSVPRQLSEIAIERVAHYEALENGTVLPGWPTRFPWLTAALMGGMRPGNLYLLAARPSVGKSSLSQSIGLAFAEDGLPTLFLSQEMSASQVADRGVASVGRVSYSALLSGTMDREHWSRASEAMERLGRLPFYVDDTPALTLRVIRAKAKAIPGLKVLILDYLQLCSSTRRDGNRNAEIEEISRGLKVLAKELGIAVIALSQLNREVEKRHNKRPALSDLRDSGSLEQDADVVLFLWPVREFESEGRRILGLGIDKNREGRCGEIGLDFYGDTQRWAQSAADIRPAPAARTRGDDL